VVVVVAAVSIKKLFTVKYPNVFMFVVYDFYGGGGCPEWGDRKRRRNAISALFGDFVTIYRAKNARDVEK
jgi:hypothetical protein